MSALTFPPGVNTAVFLLTSSPASVVSILCIVTKQIFKIYEIRVGMFWKKGIGGW